MGRTNITSCPVRLLNKDMCEFYVEGSFIHSFIRVVNIFAVSIMCKALLGAGRMCAFSPTRVSSDVRETEQSKVKMNKCSIRPYDKYIKAQVSIVLKNSLGLSGGWGSRR